MHHKKTYAGDLYVVAGKYIAYESDQISFPREERRPDMPEVASSSLVGPATDVLDFSLLIERFPSFFD